jgi:hypothetical protein
LYFRSRRRCNGESACGDIANCGEPRRTRARCNCINVLLTPDLLATPGGAAVSGPSRSSGPFERLFGRVSDLNALTVRCTSGDCYANKLEKAQRRFKADVRSFAALEFGNEANTDRCLVCEIFAPNSSGLTGAQQEGAELG